MAVPTLQEVQDSLQSFHTSRGLRRYLIQIEHDGLHKHQVIKGEYPGVVANKAHKKLLEWDAMWKKRQVAEAQRKAAANKKAAIQEKKKHADQLTSDAQAGLGRLKGTLAATLDVDDTVDWDELKNLAGYPEPRPLPPEPPLEPSLEELPTRPTMSSEQFKKSLSFLEKLIPSKRQTKLGEAQGRWDQTKQSADRDYELQLLAHKEAIVKQKAEYDSVLARWKATEEQYLTQRDAENVLVDELMSRYHGLDPEAVEEYCSLVLEHSDYPDYFPQSYALQYNPDNKLLLIDYELPDIEVLPTLREVKYVQSRDAFDEKHIPDSTRRGLYDSLIYQMALRTIHEVYEADRVNALASVVFNGIVESIDRATGQETRACILSLQATRDEFLAINLAAVDPKECFRKLRGVAASKIHSLTPVAPIIKLDRDDERFVEGYAVGDSIDESDNLAMMDWEDFEHLIREIFEKEFGQAGAEVKVTRASRDAGVDAVVLDPDPLRGGKIVIQAKRYANTVGVSAVRDLYGTLMNEGAIKGILVTTSNYGPDAYEFAKGKPLTLLDGANLLHLLERHGHKARIDLKEAKEYLRESR